MRFTVSPILSHIIISLYRQTVTLWVKDVYTIISAIYWMILVYPVISCCIHKNGDGYSQKFVCLFHLYPCSSMSSSIYSCSLISDTLWFGMYMHVHGNLSHTIIVCWYTISIYSVLVYLALAIINYNICDHIILLFDCFEINKFMSSE